MTARPAETGFTLIELMIALALFGLIAVAGLAMVDSVLGVRTRTEHRLDRLAELDRAMFLLTADLDEIAGSPMLGEARALSFSRHAHAPGGIAVPIRYTLEGGSIIRTVGGPTGGTQVLLRGVSSLRWRYYAARGWSDRWPAVPAESDAWPSGVAIDVRLAPGNEGPTGALRRVITLPVHP
jgi:general secretion pathway protein J